MTDKKTVSEGTLKARTRRSFLGGLVSALVGWGGWEWMRTRSDEFDLPWPFRRVLSWNEKLWRTFFSRDRNVPLVNPRPAGTELRSNGEEGLETALDATNWRLRVQNLSLTINELKGLPRTESSCLFKCIEGWSEEISYAGVRFSDFVRHYQLKTEQYVGLITPDEKYYVSIDLESMLHPQTLLTYELNGTTLREENGAPLRLIIPVKYGIKNLKRIGTIFFSATRPPDYWHEQGYDWYAGL